MKVLTYAQVVTAKGRAARFVQNVLQDEDRAAEIEGESPEEYAERKHIRIQNPIRDRRNSMATKRQLEEQVRELEQENEQLQDVLDSIADLVVPEDEEEEPEEPEEEEEGE